MYLVIPFPTPSKVVRETTVPVLTKKKIAVHVHHTFWYLFIQYLFVQYPRIREKETLGTIYIKVHEISTKKSNC